MRFSIDWKAADDRRTPKRQREMSVAGRLRFGVRRCCAAFLTGRANGEPSDQILNCFEIGIFLGQLPET